MSHTSLWLFQTVSKWRSLYTPNNNMGGRLPSGRGRTLSETHLGLEQFQEGTELWVPAANIQLVESVSGMYFHAGVGNLSGVRGHILHQGPIRGVTRRRRKERKVRNIILHILCALCLSLCMFPSSVQ